MKRILPYLPAVGIFFLALLVRVAYNLTVARGYLPTFDSGVYQKIALNLLHSRCFCQLPGVQTTGRAPLWPLVIAVIYRLFGVNNLSVRLFLSCLGSGTCVLVYLFARDICGRRIGLLAGIIAAIYPNLFIYDGWLYSESLYTFLLLAFCYTLYLIQRTKQARWMMLSGFLAGLLALERPNGVIIPVLVVVWAVIVIWKAKTSWRVAASSAAIIALITVALVLPWTLRNYTLTHRLIPVATGDGTVLLGAYNDKVLSNTPSYGTWVGPTGAVPQIADRNYTSDTARDDAYKAYVSQWIRGHLNEMPYLLSLHIVKMWTPSTSEEDLPMNQFPTRLSSQVTMDMINVMSYPIFLLAALGLVVTRKWWRELLFIYLILIETVALCIYFYGSSRFRAPIEPFLVILAAAAIGWIAGRCKTFGKHDSNERDHEKIGETVETSEAVLPSLAAEQRSPRGEQ